jgi:hypothetical protein
MSEAEKSALRWAMGAWQEQGRNVRFLERTTQKSFVTFSPDGTVDNRNQSDIGMQGSEQRLWLEPITASDNRQRAARHELGHTLGFHHEHVRCDRDSFVNIDMSKIPLFRYGDYFKQCGPDYQMIGTYDFRSTMHYRPRTTRTTDGSVDITALDPDNQEALDDGKRITATDGTALAELHGGNAHVYQLSSDGQLEKTVKQYAWSDGWSTLTPFGLGDFRFLFILKASNGRAKVLRINLDGSLGETIFDRDWTSGWTSATQYAIGPFSYLFLYKRGDGTRHLNRINGDGTIGPQAVSSASIEAGWTSIRQYTIGLNNYLLFSNASSGELRVRSIDLDGSEGMPIQTRNERTGWTSVQPYSTGGKLYLLLSSASSGEYRIRRIRDDGTVGLIEHSGNIGAGWSTMLPYRVAGTSYLFMCSKEDGRVRIRRLESQGDLGQTTDRRDFGPGWGIARGYRVLLGTYLLVVKT